MAIRQQHPAFCMIACKHRVEIKGYKGLKQSLPEHWHISMDQHLCGNPTSPFSFDHFDRAYGEEAYAEFKKLCLRPMQQLLMKPEVRNDLQPSLPSIHYSSRLTPHANTQTSPQHGIDPALHKLPDSTRNTHKCGGAKIAPVTFCFLIKVIDRGAVHATWRITALIQGDGWLMLSLCCPLTRLEMWLDYMAEREEKSTLLVQYHSVACTQNIFRQCKKKSKRSTLNNAHETIKQSREHHHHRCHLNDVRSWKYDFIQHVIVKYINYKINKM